MKASCTGKKFDGICILKSFWFANPLFQRPITLWNKNVCGIESPLAPFSRKGEKILFCGDVCIQKGSICQLMGDCTTHSLLKYPSNYLGLLQLENRNGSWKSYFLNAMLGSLMVEPHDLLENDCFLFSGSSGPHSEYAHLPLIYGSTPFQELGLTLSTWS